MIAAHPRTGYDPLPTAWESRRRGHLSTARARILDVLIHQPEFCTVAALSKLIRHHPNTIREHLDGLVDDRLAIKTRALAQGSGRPAWLFSAAPEASSELGAPEYAALASALVAQIARTSRQPRADAIEAGRMWGRQLVRGSPLAVAVAAGERPVLDTGAEMAPSAIAARRGVVTLLEELGFAPIADARVGVVKLRPCPLLEAAHQHPEVVCGVQLGVVRGALDELGADADRTERTALLSFSEPGACRLDLLPRSATDR